MLFKNISILDENLEYIENMYVGIKDGFIDYIGRDRPQDGIYGEEYCGRNRLLMSGFYNAHTHSPMTLMRGYGEGLSLDEWLNKKVFPFEDHLDSHAAYYATMLAMAESIKSGIISSSDMYYFCDDIVEAVKRSGVKMNVSRSISHFDDSDFRSSKRYIEAVELIDRYNGCADGRIIADASIHAEYTTTEDSVKVMAELIHEKNVRMQLHMSETRKEHEECIMRHGKTPAEYFRDAGIFDMPTSAAHCIWLDEGDYEILKEKNVTVVTNPVSNMKLASGIADIRKMQKYGINIALGTDSVSSNNSLDFFEEMKILSLSGKIKTMDPTVLRPDEVLRIATINGARAQGREKCGLLKKGYKADLIVIDMDTPNMQPVHDIRTSLVFSAHPENVVLTMCEGKVLYRDGEFLTIDIEKVKAETIKAVNRILGELR